MSYNGSGCGNWRSPNRVPGYSSALTWWGTAVACSIENKRDLKRGDLAPIHSVEIMTD